MLPTHPRDILAEILTGMVHEYNLTGALHYYELSKNILEDVEKEDWSYVECVNIAMMLDIEIGFFHKLMIDYKQGKKNDKV